MNIPLLFVVAVTGDEPSVVIVIVLPDIGVAPTIVTSLPDTL